MPIHVKAPEHDLADIEAHLAPSSRFGGPGKWCLSWRGGAASRSTLKALPCCRLECLSHLGDVRVSNPWSESALASRTVSNARPYPATRNRKPLPAIDTPASPDICDTASSANECGPALTDPASVRILERRVYPAGPLTAHKHPWGRRLPILPRLLRTSEEELDDEVSTASAVGHVARRQALRFDSAFERFKSCDPMRGVAKCLVFHERARKDRSLCIIELGRPLLCSQLLMHRFRASQPFHADVMTAHLKTPEYDLIG
jgi:hypothetical protein